MNDYKRNEKRNEDKKLTVFPTELDTTQIDLYTAKTSPNKFRAPKPDSLLPGFLSIICRYEYKWVCVVSVKKRSDFTYWRIPSGFMGIAHDDSGAIRTKSSFALECFALACFALISGRIMPCFIIFNNRY